MAILEAIQGTTSTTEPVVRKRRRSKIPPRSTRMHQIYEFLENEKRWVSTQEIHDKFPYVKRTLRATLSSMVESGNIQRVLSLRDTRVKLYRVTPK
ncbi:MAG: hypothetical protein ACW976_05740 [Candidatus Ranarchaeia archaeon]